MIYVTRGGELLQKILYVVMSKERTTATNSAAGGYSYSPDGGLRVIITPALLLLLLLLLNDHNYCSSAFPTTIPPSQYVWYHMATNTTPITTPIGGLKITPATTYLPTYRLILHSDLTSSRPSACIYFLGTSSSGP